VSCSLADITFITPASSADVRAASPSSHHLGSSRITNTGKKKIVTRGVMKCRTPDKIYFVRLSTAGKAQPYGGCNMEQPLQVCRQAMTKIAVKLAPKGASGLTAAEATCLCRGDLQGLLHRPQPLGRPTR